MMGQSFKALFKVAVALLLLIAVALLYLNFIYLPQKVRSKGPAYLKEKTRGRVRAEAINYIPFKGVKLTGVSVISKKEEPLFALDKVYFKAALWPLFLRREIDFRIDLYPQGAKKPFTFNGLYRIEKQLLDLNFKLKSPLFKHPQTITGTATALMEKEGSKIELSLSSHDLDVQGAFYIKNKDLQIERLSGEIADSAFDIIGDVQDLSRPSLNLYADLEIDLAGLKKLNPEYTKLPQKLIISGNCPGEVFIAGEAANPQMGLKVHSRQIKVEGAELKELSLVAGMKDRKVSLSKFYAKLCEGEINLEAECALDSKELPASLNLNIFNLELNRAIKDIIGEDTPVHGRLFTLARLEGSLKNLDSVQGKSWLSITGSNILQLPVFKGLGEALRFPELRKVKFTEASGNFAILNRCIQTNDFKIASKNVVIYFKGNMDFDGKLGFDIEPNFSEKLLGTESKAGQVLGMLFDSTTGNFMGRIQLKGDLENPRYTFTPIAPKKLLQKGLERGLQELFKLRKEEQ